VLARLHTRVAALLDRCSVPLFLAVITLCNLLSATLTQLSGDEALYAYYAQHLSWGYFDHPPMMALYVFTGTRLAAIFGYMHTEWAVRLCTVLSFTATLYLLWLVVKTGTQKRIFFSTVLSFFLLQFFGFVATPDSPLLLWVSFFIFCYQRFLQSNTTIWAAYLGISLAGMMYCKYHAALLIMLALLGNLPLLKQARAWFAVAIGLMLFIPHLYWQWQHDFPTLQYHLSDRASAFKISYVGDYLGSVVGAYALLALPAIIFVLRQKYMPGFLRSMQFIVLGFLFFFLIMTTRGHVQAQWVMPVVPGLIVLLCFRVGILCEKYLFISAFFSTIAGVLLRLALATPYLPLRSGFHGNKELMTSIAKKRIAGQPVLFHDTYQYASLFQFYGRDSNVYNTYSYYGRAGEYQVHKGNDAYVNQKNLLAVFTLPTSLSDSVYGPQKSQGIVYTKQMLYNAYDALRLTEARQLNDSTFSGTLYNPYSFAVEVGGTSKIILCACIYSEDGKTLSVQVTRMPVLGLPPNWYTAVTFTLQQKLPHDSLSKRCKFFFMQDGVLEGPTCSVVLKLR
jgi:hypothetical protein